VILLSGDRHLSESHGLEDPALGDPLYELTSSGMTHSFTNVGNEPNRYRVGELYEQLSYGTVAFDWDGGSVTLRIHDVAGGVACEQVVPLNEIGGGAN
jgi:alkaline phosphatase D